MARSSERDRDRMIAMSLARIRSVGKQIEIDWERFGEGPFLSIEGDEALFDTYHQPNYLFMH